MTSKTSVGESYTSRCSSRLRAGEIPMESPPCSCAPLADSQGNPGAAPVTMTMHLRATAAPSSYARFRICLLYTSDAADDLLCVDLGGRRIIKKKKKKNQ